MFQYDENSQFTVSYAFFSIFVKFVSLESLYIYPFLNYWDLILISYFIHLSLEYTCDFYFKIKQFYILVCSIPVKGYLLHSWFAMSLSEHFCQAGCVCTCAKKVYGPCVCLSHFYHYCCGYLDSHLVTTDCIDSDSVISACFYISPCVSASNGVTLSAFLRIYSWHHVMLLA